MNYVGSEDEKTGLYPETFNEMARRCFGSFPDLPKKDLISNFTDNDSISSFHT